MDSLSRESILTVVLGGVAVYFSFLMVRGLSIYLRFRRVMPTAVLTWPVQPRGVQLLMFLGAIAAVVALASGFLHRPLHQIYSQWAIAAYFILMVPLLGRVHLGLYQDGVWAERGFLPYDKIGRMAFLHAGVYLDRPFAGPFDRIGRVTLNGPEKIILVLVPRGGGGSYRLPVPPDDYGAVRKVLEEKIRARELNVEAGILGLEERSSV